MRAKSPFVFTSERGAPFSTAGFARMVERAGADAKLGAINICRGQRKLRERHDTLLNRWRCKSEGSLRSPVRAPLPSSGTLDTVAPRWVPARYNFFCIFSKRVSLALIERAAQSSQKWIDEAGLNAEYYKRNCYFESLLSQAVAASPSSSTR
jgi:hypothetical protein